MKRLWIVLLVMLLLCGCVAQKADEPIVQTTMETTEPTKTTETTVPTATITDDSNAQSEYEAWLEEINNPIDGEGMIPLLFVDTQRDTQKAFLICAGKDGEFYIADRFMYNGKQLYTESDSFGGCDYQEGPYTTKILDQDRQLIFTDFADNSFTTKVKQLTGEYEVIITFMKLLADLEQPVPESSRFYLGTYADAEMFPQDAVYTDTGIETDLDGDGAVDRVSLLLTEEQPCQDPYFDYDGYYYSYKLDIVRNGKTYTFLPFGEIDIVAKGDIRVFAADVDQDGEFEVLMYRKCMLRFDSLTIYDFNGTDYDEIVYSISPQN